jgi:methylated-DNA-[protein]-cysteine S-methyltransferase
MQLQTTILRSPIGPLSLFVGGEALVAIDFGAGEHARARLERRFGEIELTDEGDACRAAARRIADYLDGALDALDALATDPGGTEFQQEVWRGLRAIPVGTAISYGDLARAIGRPKAVRAVGGANHDNPIPIVIPCHRVIGGDGSLTGYGGGLDVKRWLLRHEGIDLLE